MDNDLKLIKAELAILLKRLEKLEHSVKGGMRSAPLQSYVDELEREALKVMDQIR
ncbi:hypothetical protein [Alistipes sp. CAG:29]|jgi:hypothetical protein|uniref:hypothetical protein n=1 Tax=Alistipes TaxID=239759 RepID=UPI0003371424|nr:hypothetical protein [Alistipes sp. CAG:29]CDD24091.1 unknown [Alistipes sp. CAG:29]